MDWEWYSLPNLCRASGGSVSNQSGYCLAERSLERQANESMIADHCWLIQGQKSTCMVVSNLECAKGFCWECIRMGDKSSPLSCDGFLHSLIYFHPFQKLWCYTPYRSFEAWNMFYTGNGQSAIKYPNFVSVSVPVFHLHFHSDSWGAPKNQGIGRIECFVLYTSKEWMPWPCGALVETWVFLMAGFVSIWTPTCCDDCDIIKRIESFRQCHLHQTHKFWAKAL